MVVTREEVVLIVDDDVDAADLLAQVLETGGLRTVRASSSADALFVLAALDVDLLITDFDMPGADGLELCAHLRRHAPWSRVPIIVISGVDLSGGIARAARACGAWFLGKPIDVEVFWRVVRSALGRRLA